MKHNLRNPKCPECGGITHKMGFIVTREGKKQRFHCIECGFSFTIRKEKVKADV